MEDNITLPYGGDIVPLFHQHHCSQASQHWLTQEMLGFSLDSCNFSLTHFLVVGVLQDAIGLTQCLIHAMGEEYMVQSHIQIP